MPEEIILPLGNIACCRVARDHLDPLAEACLRTSELLNPFYVYDEPSNSCFTEGTLKIDYIGQNSEIKFSEYESLREKSPSEVCCSAKRNGERGENLENSCTSFDEPEEPES